MRLDVPSGFHIRNTAALVIALMMTLTIVKTMKIS
jgi:hypothetical protein